MDLHTSIITLFCMDTAVRPVYHQPVSGRSLRAVLMKFLCLNLLLGGRGIASAQQSTEDQIKDIVIKLSAPEAQVRSTAAWALGQLGSAAKGTAPELIADLNDNVSGVRASAAFALGYIGAEPGAVLPALSMALRDPDHEVRTSAGFALAHIGNPGVPVLAAALSDKASGVRRDAASALGGMEIKPVTAVPALVALLGDPDADVRDTAVWTLKDIGGAAAPALATALHAKRNIVRRSAATALGYIGAEALSAVPALRIALRDPDTDVRREADQALTSIGTPAPSRRAEQAVQEAIFKYLFADFKVLKDVKLVRVSLAVGKVSPAQLQRLQRAGMPARVDSDRTWAEIKALPALSDLLWMQIDSLRWMSGGEVLASVEVFTSQSGDVVSFEHYALLRVRRIKGAWKVLGTVGEWAQGGE